MSTKLEIPLITGVLVAVVLTALLVVFDLTRSVDYPGGFTKYEEACIENSEVIFICDIVEIDGEKHSRVREVVCYAAQADYSEMIGVVLNHHNPERFRTNEGAMGSEAVVFCILADGRMGLELDPSGTRYFNESITGCTLQDYLRVIDRNWKKS